MRRVVPAAGFTLVECMTVCAVAAVLMTVALPSLRGHELRMARIDAVDALTRLQMAQEKHRSLHGLYANDLAALQGAAVRSPQGRYTLVLASTGPDAYLATANPQGVQAQDRDCPALTLAVSQGLAQTGPSARCWNR